MTDKPNIVERLRDVNGCSIQDAQCLDQKQQAADLIEAYQRLESACREWSKIYDEESMVDDPIIWALRELDQELRGNG